MKKILSIILGVFLFIMPMAGCEKDEGLTGIYYSEKQWLFKDDGEQETVLIISSTVAVTVLVASATEWEGSSLYLYKDELDKIEALFNSILHKKTPMKKTDTIRGGTITFTAYDLYGITKTLWVEQDGRVVYWYGGEYYVSEKGMADYQEIRRCCSDWRQDYNYTLRKTGDQLFFLQEEQSIVSLNLQDVSFGSIGRCYDSVRADIDTPLKREMILSALRLEKGLIFREMTVSPVFMETIGIVISYFDVVYNVFILKEGSLAVNLNESNVYYITNDKAVRYNLFLELFEEWRF